MGSEPRATAIIRVVVVDDHELVRVGMVRTIDAEADLSVVGEAGTAAQALASFPMLAPDVAVIDERLPDGHGVGICRFLRRTSPDTRSIIFSGLSSPATRMGARAAGAYGCLFKTVPVTRLVDAIRWVAAGRTLWDDGPPGVVPGGSDDRLARLSSTEHRVLAMLAEAKTNVQIAEALGLAEQTVKNLVSSLMAKAGFHSRSEAAVYMVRLNRIAADTGHRLPREHAVVRGPLGSPASGLDAGGPAALDGGLPGGD
ncbi:MAG TPA: response regulator transcription factor [Acidimicrobiales bacterium]|nr:response regulator transcription factor [Acidimicrobiales bacterium]